MVLIQKFYLKKLAMLKLYPFLLNKWLLKISKLLMNRQF